MLYLLYITPPPSLGSARFVRLTYRITREGERSSPFKWISDVCWYGTEDPIVDSIVVLVRNCDRDVDEIRYQLVLSCGCRC